MRAVVQRVSSASVAIDGETVGRIGRGYLVLLGVGHGDTPVSYTHLDVYKRQVQRAGRYRLRGGPWV